MYVCVRKNGFESCANVNGVHRSALGNFTLVYMSGFIHGIILVPEKQTGLIVYVIIVFYCIHLHV